MSLTRKAGKALRALRSGLSLRALRYGVAPSWEHADLLAGLGPLCTVVDVGANVGQFALLTRLVQPRAQIHSFEPMQDACTMWQRVMAGQARAVLHRAALSSRAGTMPLHISARADSSSLLPPAAQADMFPGTHQVGVEQVRCAPLGDFVGADALQGPALLKIDVQGAELDVLRGCADLLHCFKWIYCEASFVELYKDQPLAAEIISWLADQGFDLDGVNVDRMMLRKGRAIQADFLFRNRAQDALQ